MHPTTRELLEEIRKASEMDDAAEAWMAIDYHAAQWKGAGYPDLPKPAAPTLETCWTCCHQSRRGIECLALGTAGKVLFREINEWCLANHEDGAIMPPHNYSGPPCPGWKAKE